MSRDSKFRSLIPHTSYLPHILLSPVSMDKALFIASKRVFSSSFILVDLLEAISYFSSAQNPFSIGKSAASLGLGLLFWQGSLSLSLFPVPGLYSVGILAASEHRRFTPSLDQDPRSSFHLRSGNVSHVEFLPFLRSRSYPFSTSETLRSFSDFEDLSGRWASLLCV